MAFGWHFYICSGLYQVVDDALVFHGWPIKQKVECLVELMILGTLAA